MHIRALGCCCVCLFLRPTDGSREATKRGVALYRSEVSLSLECCVTRVTDVSEKLPQCTALRYVDMNAVLCSFTVRVACYKFTDVCDKRYCRPFQGKKMETVCLSETSVKFLPDYTASRPLILADLLSSFVFGFSKLFSCFIFRRT